MNFIQYENLKQNIQNLPNKLERFGYSIEDILQNKSIHLIDIEDSLVLWNSIENGYFYTDLELNHLFGCYFEYATPFSNGQAVIRFNGKNSIIDINNVTITEIPLEIEYNHSRKNIVHGNLATFRRQIGKWGSYRYDSDEHTYQEDIPFIWDRLEFSRYKNFVYGGFNTYVDSEIYIDGAHCLTSNYGSFISSESFDEYNKLKSMQQEYEYKKCYTQVYRLNKRHFYDAEGFKKAIENIKSLGPYMLEQRCVVGSIYRPHYNLTNSLIDELTSECDIRDYYFSENLITNYGYKEPTLLENNIKNYKLIKGKYRM